MITSFNGGKSSDTILDFNSRKGDRLAVDFSGMELSEYDSITFAVAADQAEYKSLKKDAPLLIYREDKGDLMFDSNGSAKGLGDGGKLLHLKGAPELVGGDLFSLSELIDSAI